MGRRIIVTDVTEMKGRFCVAGWEAGARRMVRPLLKPGHTWSAQEVGPGKLWPGNVLTFEDKAAAPGTEFPHATEDTILSGRGLTIEKAAVPATWVATVAASAGATLGAAFGSHVTYETRCGERRRTAVRRGTRAPSLGAVVLPPGRLEYYEDDRGKLRVRLRDPDAAYSLPVVCHAINRLKRQSGLRAVQDAFGAGRRHVRLGLARAFDKYPDECFVMVNGAHPC